MPAQSPTNFGISPTSYTGAGAQSSFNPNWGNIFGDIGNLAGTAGNIYGGYQNMQNQNNLTGAANRGYMMSGGAYNPTFYGMNGVGGTGFSVSSPTNGRPGSINANLGAFNPMYGQYAQQAGQYGNMAMGLAGSASSGAQGAYQSALASMMPQLQQMQGNLLAANNNGLYQRGQMGSGSFGQMGAGGNPVNLTTQSLGAGFAQQDLNAIMAAQNQGLNFFNSNMAGAQGLGNLGFGSTNAGLGMIGAQNQMGQMPLAYSGLTGNQQIGAANAMANNVRASNFQGSAFGSGLGMFASQFGGGGGQNGQGGGNNYSQMFNTGKNLYNDMFGGGAAPVSAADWSSAYGDVASGAAQQAGSDYASIMGFNSAGGEAAGAGGAAAASSLGAPAMEAGSMADVYGMGMEGADVYGAGAGGAAGASGGAAAGAGSFAYAAAPIAVAAYGAMKAPYTLSREHWNNVNSELQTGDNGKIGDLNYGAGSTQAQFNQNTARMGLLFDQLGMSADKADIGGANGATIPPDVIANYPGGAAQFYADASRLQQDFRTPVSQGTGTSLTTRYARA